MDLECDIEQSRMFTLKSELWKHVEKGAKRSLFCAELTRYILVTKIW